MMYVIWYDIWQIKCFSFYATKLQQNIFIEKDPNSNCHEYKDDSYADCDDDFVKKCLGKITNLPNFTPIWATDNITEVTPFLETNSSFGPHYNMFVEGLVESG